MAMHIYRRKGGIYDIAATAKRQTDENERCMDNIFIERLWRSLEHECVYLHAWETGSQAKAGVSRWISFYNHQRSLAAHGGRPPAVGYFNSIETDQHVRAALTKINARNHGAKQLDATALSPVMQSNHQRNNWN